jgi:hypothetical protein
METSGNALIRATAFRFLWSPENLYQFTLSSVQCLLNRYNVVIPLCEHVGNPI